MAPAPLRGTVASFTLTIRLTATEKARLGRIAKSQRTTMSAIGGEAIAEYVSDCGEAPPLSCRRRPSCPWRRTCHTEGQP